MGVGELFFWDTLPLEYEDWSESENFPIIEIQTAKKDEQNESVMGAALAQALKHEVLYNEAWGIQGIVNSPFSRVYTVKMTQLDIVGLDYLRDKMLEDISFEEAVLGLGRRYSKDSLVRKRWEKVIDQKYHVTPSHDGYVFLAHESFSDVLIDTFPIEEVMFDWRYSFQRGFLKNSHIYFYSTIKKLKLEARYVWTDFPKGIVMVVNLKALQARVSYPRKLELDGVKAISMQLHGVIPIVETAVGILKFPS